MDYLKINRLKKNLKIQYAYKNQFVASRGFSIFRSEDFGKNWKKIGKIKKKWTNIFAINPILSQILRAGISILFPITENIIIVIVDGEIYRSTNGGLTWSFRMRLKNGRSPLRSGICFDKDNRLYIGEYYSNKNRGQFNLLRSDDLGRTWFVAHKWKSKSIRHIHFVQYDKFTNSIWVGTGDADNECAFYRSCDGGISFEIVGKGSQIWRAVSLLFIEDAVVWGTDLGRDQLRGSNYIMMLNRKERKIKRLVEIEGPVYYSINLGETLILGTAVEKGPLERSNKLCLYYSRNGIDWKCQKLWPRISLPSFLGHGYIIFPYGEFIENEIPFTPIFIKSRNNGALMRLRVLDKFIANNNE
ncbi:MAG: WD40/YVTN/BNR-like repeat-containing protein [Promethearchaeota archaeon]